MENVFSVHPNEEHHVNHTRTNNRDRRFQSRKTEQISDEDMSLIRKIEEYFQDAMQPFTVSGITGYHQNVLRKYFEKSEEYSIKSYHEGENILLKVYPLGKLRRCAEQATQEVLMKGKPVELSVMGSYERFIIHDYLKDREGVYTESLGEEGKNRHVMIHPLFGRQLRKEKKKLIR